MCLIVCKPKGLPLPKSKDLQRWFAHYPDGFGVAFQYQDQVRLLKGAMDTKAMFALIDRMRKLVDVKKVDVVIQFRTAVTGSVCPKYCHPFPISPNQEELDSLDVTTGCTLAHNGVISRYSNFADWRDYYTYQAPYSATSVSTLPVKTDKNDAQEFIKDYLVGLGDTLWNPAVQNLIRDFTDSKFALLSSRGIAYIGEFTEDKGYKYSNTGYKGISILAGISAFKETAIEWWSKKDRDYEEFANEEQAYYPPDTMFCACCGEPYRVAYSNANSNSVCKRCYPYFRDDPMEEE